MYRGVQKSGQFLTGARSMEKMGRGSGVGNKKKKIKMTRNISSNMVKDESGSISNTKRRKELYVAVVELREEKNMSVRTIAAELNIPKSTVHEYLAAWKQKTPVEKIQDKGRPKKLNSADKKVVRKLFVDNPSSTINDVRNALHASHGKLVSRSTVGRMMADMGLRYGKPQMVPQLTDTHKKKRVEWCKEHKKMELDGVFFTDETYIEVGGAKNGVWFKRGNRPKVGKSKFPTKLMFWGAISCHAKSPLFAIDGAMNSERYISLLRDEFFKWMLENGIELTAFQKDNASCHTSRRSKQFFVDQGIQVLEWPANSPDLNPIENIWGILKECVRKRSPKTKEELQQVAIEEWAAIPQKVVAKTIKSFPKRCDQVVKRGGEKCDY
jgi:transposase